MKRARFYCYFLNAFILYTNWSTLILGGYSSAIFQVFLTSVPTFLLAAEHILPVSYESYQAQRSTTAVILGKKRHSFGQKLNNQTKVHFFT